MRLLKENIFDERDVFFRYNSERQLVQYRHDHDFFEIFLVVQGSVQHEKNGTKQRCDAGRMVFIKDTDLHRFEADQQVQVLNVAFSSAFYTRVSDLFGTGIGTLEVQLDKEKCLHYLAGFEELMTGGVPDNREVRLKVLLIEMLSHFWVSSEKKRPDEPQWFYAFVKNISRPEMFTRKLPELYKEADRSPEHIARTFQKYRQTTPGEYLMKLRLQYAGNLLALSDRAIIDICYETGFQNLSYFYRCFKARYGMTPQEYRRRHSEKI